MFDEINLQPLYKLIAGKPGSSYTFLLLNGLAYQSTFINNAKNC